MRRTISLVALMLVAQWGVALPLVQWNTNGTVTDVSGDVLGPLPARTVLNTWGLPADALKWTNGQIVAKTAEELPPAPVPPPMVFAYGIEVTGGDMVCVGSNTVVLPGVPGLTAGYSLWVDTNTETVVAVQDHGSPKKPKPEQQQKAAAKAAKLKTARDSLATAKTQSEKVDAIFAWACAQAGVTNAP